MTRILELRYDLAINQKEFARRIGFSVSQFARLEKGKIPLTRTTAQKIATAFNVEVGWLLSAGRVPIRRTIRPYIPPKREKIRIDDSITNDYARYHAWLAQLK